jgi:hypothetical protein
MKSRSIRSERYDLIVFENFEYKGQNRHRAHRVGSATASPKGGYMLYIPAGISLSGRVMMVPERTSFTEVDLLEAYQSAADEHGL